MNSGQLNLGQLNSGQLLDLDSYYISNLFVHPVLWIFIKNNQNAVARPSTERAFKTCLYYSAAHRPSIAARQRQFHNTFNGRVIFLAFLTRRGNEKWKVMESATVCLFTFPTKHPFVLPTFLVFYWCNFVHSPFSRPENPGEGGSSTMDKYTTGCPNKVRVGNWEIFHSSIQSESIGSSIIWSSIGKGIHSKKYCKV